MALSLVRGLYKGILMHDQLVLFSMKHQFKKLFFMIRHDLKALHDPRKISHRGVGRVRGEG